jgi:hypothetical protein
MVRTYSTDSSCWKPHPPDTTDGRVLTEHSRMKRILIVGPGASGKSTLARRLGEITGLRVIELDKVFWQPGLLHLPKAQWIQLQQSLVQEDEWIMDGDLGPYDAMEVRLRAADTIVFLDFAWVRCAWRAIRRSRERLDFWLWLFHYRRRSRPLLMEAIRMQAPAATVHVLRNPHDVQRFVTAQLTRPAVDRAILRRHAEAPGGPEESLPGDRT